MSVVETKLAPPVEIDFKDGAKVKFRIPSRITQRDIIKKATIRTAKIEDGKAYPYEYIDEFLYQDLWIDQWIAGWSGLEEDGKSIPCTLEKKMLIYMNDEGFRTFVNETIAKLMKAEDTAKEDAEKNS